MNIARSSLYQQVFETVKRIHEEFSGSSLVLPVQPLGSMEIADIEATEDSTQEESAERAEDPPSASNTPAPDQTVAMNQDDQLSHQLNPPVQPSVDPTTLELQATITSLQKNKEESDQAYSDLLKQHHQLRDNMIKQHAVEVAKIRNSINHEVELRIAPHVLQQKATH